MACACRMEAEEWFVVRQEEAENLRKKEVLGELQKCVTHMYDQAFYPLNEIPLACVHVGIFGSKRSKRGNDGFPSNWVKADKHQDFEFEIMYRNLYSG